MKKNLILLALLITVGAYSQTPVENAEVLKKHSVYLELLGSSMFYSLNYDYLIPISPETKLAVGTGVGFVDIHSYDSYSPEPVNKNIFYVTPQVNLLIGAKSHHLETGLSLSSLTGFGGRIGYRYQRPKGGFMFRISYTPFLSKPILSWGGVSFGYTF